MKMFLISALALTISLPMLSLTLPKLDIDSYKLPNGLTVYLYEDHSTPIVAININYKVGSKNEEPGRTGFAHLFEHMMFQGSKNFNMDYFMALQDIGGRVNGATNQDRTRYLEIVPSNYLERALWLESDRMGFLLDAMTRERLDNQISVVRNEKKQNYDDAPYGKSYGEMLKILYPPEHPYSWPTIGSDEDLKAAGIDDVKEFFRTYYTPSNATLCIAGDFDPEETKRLVEKYFASLPPGRPIAHYASWVPAIDGVKRRVTQDRVQLAQITMVWPTVPLYAEHDAELDLFAKILGQGKTSRLYQSVLKEKSLVSDITAYHSSGQLAGHLGIVATALPGKNLDEIEAAIIEELHKILKEGVTADELKQAVNNYSAEFIRALERVGWFGGISDQITAYDHYLGKPDMFQWDLDRYLKIDLAGILKSANSFIGNSYGVVEVHPYNDLKALEEEVDRTVKPEGAKTPELKLPSPLSFTLSNGMKVLALHYDELPLASVHLVLSVGSSADPADFPGLANLTGNMLMEGTATRSAEKIKQELDSLGSNLYIDVNSDATIARLSSLTVNLDDSLDILFDIIQNPLFPEKELNVKKKRLASRFLQMQDSMYGMAGAVINKNLFRGHPYGHLSIGTPEAVEAARANDLKKFHDSFYNPMTATLVFVGPHSEEELKDLLEPKARNWKGSKTSLTKVARQPDPSKPAIFFVDKPGSQQSMVVVATMGIERGNPNYVKSTLANHILGGYFMSRLNMNLREDKGYTYGARSRFSTKIAAGPWTAGAPVQGDATAASIKEIFKEIRGILGEIPISEEEFIKSKNNLLLSIPTDLETPSDLAYKLEDIALYSLPFDTINREYGQLKKTSLKDVKKAAESFLKDKVFQVFIVGDKESILDEVKEMDLGEIVFCDRLGNPID